MIFHHLPKTAGSSLGQVVRANLRPGEFFVDNSLQFASAGLPDEESFSVREASLGWWRDWYESLTGEERARIRCVASHTAQFLVPSVHDRPVRPFALLRDPVERVMSLYHFALARAEADRRRGVPERLGGRQLVTGIMRENGWTVADVYRELGRRDAPSGYRLIFSFFFNGQARELLYPYLDAAELPLTPEAGDLEDYRARAFDVLSTYVVGTQERFSQSVRLFADSFGWRRAFIAKKNVAFHRPEIDEETRSLIRAYNSLDTELHAHYSAKLEGRPETGRLKDVHGKVSLRVRRGARKARRTLRAGVVRRAA